MSKTQKNNIPDKLVFTLKEISRLTDLESKTIESWENEFYFLNAGQTRSGNKIFRKKDLSIIIRIKELLDSQGFTLAGAKRKIEQEFGIKGSAPVHPERLKKTLFQIKNQLKSIITELEK